MLVLREDQEIVKSKLYHSINHGSNRVCIKAPTGFGKTVLATSIIEDALSKGTNVIFVAPLITLVNQAAQTFHKFGLTDIGFIQADHPETDYGKPIQCATPQSIASLMKRNYEVWEKYQKNKLIIFDEAHIFFKVHKTIMSLANHVIGLTATPWRQGLGNYYDDLVNGPTPRWLMENGHLCDYEAYSAHSPDFKNSDLDKGKSGDKYDKRIIGEIVENWHRLSYGEKTILFAPRVKDADRFRDEFLSAGVRASSVSGYMDDDDCKKEIDKFKNGEITVICSVIKLATGFDVPDVTCLADCQPTLSLMRHVQKGGRLLRTSPEKDIGKYLDYAGNLMRLGDLYGEDHPTTFISIPEKEIVSQSKQKKEKVCPKCGFIKTEHKCPKCGFEPAAQSELEIEPGELKKVNGTIEKAYNEKKIFIRQAKAYAIQYNKEDWYPGWLFKKKFGHYPPSKLDKEPPGESFEQAQGYVKYLEIKRRKYR